MSPMIYGTPEDGVLYAGPAKYEPHWEGNIYVIPSCPIMPEPEAQTPVLDMAAIIATGESLGFLEGL